MAFSRDGIHFYNDEYDALMSGPEGRDPRFVDGGWLAYIALAVVIAVYLLIAALVFMPVDASAADFGDGVDAPPLAYNHKPAGTVVEVQLPYHDISAVCLAENSRQIANGCAQPDAYHLLILSMQPALPKKWRAIIRGALAHDPHAVGIVIPTCGGWSYINCEMQDHIRHHEWAHANGLVHCGADARGWCDSKTWARVGV